MDPLNGLTPGVNDGTGDDPDLDGTVNLLEYVLGGDPTGGGPVLPGTSLTANDQVVTFRRSDLSGIDTTVKVQWTTDPASWLPENEVVIGAASSGIVTVVEDFPSPSLDTVSVAIPRSHAVEGKLFARVIAAFP